MPVLFFLPWVTINKSVQVGAAQLLPYERGQAPGGVGKFTQATFDVVLGNYADRAHFPSDDMGTPVRNATILWWAGDEDVSDLDDEDISARMQFGQFLAFSALAERRFDSFGWYCNTDCLALIAQRVNLASPASLAFTTRRRDGSTTTMVSGSRGKPLFLRPTHVSHRQSVNFDHALLQALVAVPDGDLKFRLLDSITLFNRANTDANEVPIAAEMIMMRAAFEALLESGYRTENLQRAFNKHFAEAFGPPTWGQGCFDEATWRGRWPKNVTRPIDAWVQDFSNARNDSAHGSSVKSCHETSIWSVSNHLIFSSWLFPLMVKAVLAKEGFFTLTDSDKDRRTICEKFFAHDVLAMRTETELYWSHVEGEINIRKLDRALYAAMNSVNEKT